MKRQDFRFFHRLQVRWAEIDQQKIVFNGHYLTYVDVAMTNYWRALGLPYEAAMASLGGDLYVKKSTLEYHASARMDDQLDITLRLERLGRSSLNFVGGIFRGEDLLVRAEVVYVFADPHTQTSRPVPQPLRDILEAYEARRAVVRIECGAWSKLGPDASAIRGEVFIDEQRIPKDLEWDEADAQAVHAVAYNHLGQPLATGRLLSHAPGQARIGRMAVLRVLRGSHLGRDILHALMDCARRRGDHEIVLHAQRSAEGFYLRQGFAPRGEPFDEAGIPHIEMFARLS